MRLNTEFRETNMDAAQFRFALLGNRPEYREALDLSELFFQQNTFYRQLYPVNFPNSPEASDRYRSYLKYSLKSKEKLHQNMELIEPVFSESCQQLTLSRARFNSIDMGSSKARIYYLPERKADSRLTIDVIQDNLITSSGFYLQFDSQPPIKFQVMPERDLKLDSYQITKQEACISNRSQHTSEEKGLEDLNANLISNVANLEIPLAAGVRKVRVWRDKDWLPSANTESVYLSLKYRASKQYQMDQELMVDLLKNQTQEKLFQGFLGFLLDKPIELPLADYQNQYLKQHWLDLKRFLRVLEADFFPGYKQTHSAKDLFQLKPGQFDYIMQAEDLSAFQVKLLKALILKRHHPQRTNKAIQKLTRFYRKYDLKLDEFRLSVIQAFNEPNKEAFKTIFFGLKELNYDRFALELGLLLFSDSKNVEMLLESAFMEKKWKLLAYLLKRLKNPQMLNLWRGYEAESKGDIKKAIAFWTDAGAAGEKANNRFNHALRVRKLLLSKDKEKQYKGLQQWVDWIKENSGSKSFKNIGNFVQSYLGIRSVYNLRRDLHKPYFVASKEQPLRLSIIGPAKLKINARLVHLHQNNMDADRSTRQDDWLEISDNNRRYHSPVSNSLASQSLKIIQPSDISVPGTNKTLYYEIGEGVHEISIAARQHQVLLSLAQETSSLVSPILPELWQPDSLLASIAGARSEALFTTLNGSSEFACMRHDCIVKRQVAYNKKSVLKYRQVLPRVDKFQSHDRQSLPSLASFFPKYPSKMKDVSGDFVLVKTLSQEQFKLFLQSYCSTDLLTTNSPNSSELKISIKSIQSTFDAEAKRSLTPFKCLLDKPDKLSSLLINIYDRYEKYPNERQYLLTWLENIRLNNLIPPSYRSLISQMTNAAKWQVEHNVLHSAGFRTLKQSGWRPVSDNLKFVQNILSLNDKQSMVLNNRDISGIYLFVEQSTQLHLTINKNRLPFQYPFPVVFQYRLDSGAWHKVELNAQQIRHVINIPLTRGEHTVNFQWLNPARNEYLSVKADVLSNQKREGIFPEKNLNYHIANYDEPLEMVIEGPAYLRFDYFNHPLKDDNLNHNNITIKNHYLSLEEGLNQVRIKPSHSNKELLLRIYKRISDESIAPKLSRLVARHIDAIPISETQSTGTKVKIPSEPTKAYQGDNSESTWALYTNLNKGVDDEIQLDKVLKNEYFETGLELYKHLENWDVDNNDSYYYGAGLLRLRSDGESSYGLKQRFYGSSN
jgi:hypothetical protein